MYNCLTKGFYNEIKDQGISHPYSLLEWSRIGVTIWQGSQPTYLLESNEIILIKPNMFYPNY